MRFRFGELAPGPSGPAIALHAWGDDHNTLVLGMILLKLYLYVPRWPNRGYDIEMGYGFSFVDTGLHLYWGKRTKVLWYPWSWDFYKRWELVQGESYAKGREFWIEVQPGMAHGQLGTKDTSQYTCKLSSGDVQEVTATYYVSHQEWRRRWFKWLSWPRKTSTCIEVDFSAEVGEGRGTWKGGTLGCGYEMKRRLARILDCLRRMERERRFPR